MILEGDAEKLVQEYKKLQAAEKELQEEAIRVASRMKARESAAHLDATLTKLKGTLDRIEERKRNPRPPEDYQI